jgi:pimeloyl-ACP methyl ester carboxylesterase
MTASVKTLRGSAQLAFTAFEGLARSVEQMHETIARRPLPWSPRPNPPTRAHGLAAATVYALVLQAIRGSGKGIDLALGALPEAIAEGVETPRSIRSMAVVNGVCGDHLEATDNPLTIRMAIMRDGLPVNPTATELATAFPDAGPHLAVLVHGLCLSELSWSRKDQPDLGSRLHEALGMTPVYLRYNSGRHISTNGREFAELLHRLLDAWPVPVESLSLVGHSMGGLVIRSGCWYGNQAGRPWLEKLRRVVYLGTPHHGSPVERAGHRFDRAMRSIQYVEPLMFGRRRSAGIKDLRHGNLLDEDWAEPGSGRNVADRRCAVPLLDGIDHFFAVASVGRHAHDLRGHLFGDLLVHSGSAVGAHPDPHKHLAVEPDHCRVFHETGHLDLLSDDEVHVHVIEWFSGLRTSPQSRSARTCSSSQISKPSER